MPQHQSLEQQAVTRLQGYLRQLSYEDERITPPPIDGIFDSVTRQSLSDLQAREGLPVTGVADRETWDVLYSLFCDSVAANSAPLPIAIFPRRPLGYELRQGDRSFYVTALQFMLRELSRDYGELLNVTPDGSFGEATVAAVSHFQSVNALPVTGAAGLATWNSIAAAYNLRADEYAR